MTRIRTWAVRLLSRSILPLIWKVYYVVTALGGTLRYILQEIVDGKLEIPEGSPIYDTWSTALSAVDAVAAALERVLMFFGESFPIETVPAARESVEALSARVRDLTAFVDAVAKEEG